MLAFPSRRPAADRAHVAATEWSRVPIRDFISLSSPLVAVSLLFFWCAAVKKEIPRNCGAAVANKKLSAVPQSSRAMPTTTVKIITITAMTTIARSKIARACGDCGLKTFTTSAINNAPLDSCICIGFLPNRRLANASVVRRIRLCRALHRNGRIFARPLNRRCTPDLCSRDFALLACA